MLPLYSASARVIACRSRSVSVGASAGFCISAGVAGKYCWWKSSASSFGESQTINVRSTRFFSSRILPRYGSEARNCMASLEISGAGLPVESACCFKKWFTRRGMSSRRSLSGGRRRVMRLMRYSRSSRKVRSCTIAGRSAFVAAITRKSTVRGVLSPSRSKVFC